MYDTVCTKVTVMCTQIYSCVLGICPTVSTCRSHSFDPMTLPCWISMGACCDSQRLLSLHDPEPFCLELPRLTYPPAEHESPCGDRCSHFPGDRAPSSWVTQFEAVLQASPLSTAVRVSRAAQDQALNSGMRPDQGSNRDFPIHRLTLNH